MQEVKVLLTACISVQLYQLLIISRLSNISSAFLCFSTFPSVNTLNRQQNLKFIYTVYAVNGACDVFFRTYNSIFEICHHFHDVVCFC